MALKVLSIGLVAGLFSAVFGVGGGIVIVPLLILLLGFQSRAAAATSIAAIWITALAGLRAEAGIASGLINTSQQIGGAVGIAILSTVAITRTENEFAAGTARPEALTSGFQLAFWVGAAIAIVGVVASLVLIRQEEIAHAGEAAPVPAA